MLLPHSHPQLQAQQRRHTHQKPQQRPAQLHLVALEIRDLQGRTICLRYFFKVELSNSLCSLQSLFLFFITARMESVEVCKLWLQLEFL